MLYMYKLYIVNNLPIEDIKNETKIWDPEFDSWKLIWDLIVCYPSNNERVKHSCSLIHICSRHVSTYITNWTP